MMGMMSMKKLLRWTTSLVLFGTLAHAATDPATVEVEFRDAKNQSVGEATLRDTPNGVLISLSLHGLPPGAHGFHVHAVGKCETPFDSAGGHFNPSTKSHGFENARGPHAGDLPNLIVAADGTVQAEVIAGGVTLQTGPGALLDADGAALVVHSGPDDYTTDPAGNSGSRIACAVVQRPA